MTTRKRTSLLLPFTLLLAALLLYLYSEKWLRSILLYLSDAGWANRFATGFPPAWYVASRFVAGETNDEAIEVTQRLNRYGFTTTMAYLGESITDRSQANQARDEILALLDKIHHSGVKGTASLKLSQLGSKIEYDLALNNMRRILERAREYGIFVRIDMEESAMVDQTLRLYRQLRDEDGFKNTGVVIQAYLYRSETDVQELAREGAAVRLCKGAYNEPPSVAFSEKSRTDQNFIELMRTLLGAKARQNGVVAGIATHDEKMIQATIDYATEQNISSDVFEFQMLYGVRRELQQALLRDGYRVRIYIPYGTSWYPYFMRRLAERPANLWFFLANFFRG